MTKVVNLRKNKYDIYIGRGTIWGNPFIIGKHGDRSKVIEKYKNHIFDNNNLLGKLHQLYNKVLGCYCKPLQCHGDILCDILNKKIWIRNWFSNMLPLDQEFTYQGMKFRTIENFYQAMKTLDVNERRKISEMSPYKAKVYIRKLPVRKDWKNIRLQVMRYGLKAKFAPGATWHQKLKQTKDKIIEWNNWGDRFWGIDVRTGLGDNYLGKLIMEIKNELFF